MSKNMPARDKMNSRRSKPPWNDKARKQTDRPAVETIIREARKRAAAIIPTSTPAADADTPAR